MGAPDALHGVWRIARCVALVALLAANVPGFAHALSLTGIEQERSLAGEMELLEDPLGQADVQQVRQRQDSWNRLPAAGLNLGYSNSAWWLRLRLHNPASQPVATVLDLQQPAQDYVDWYVLRPDGSVLMQARGGDRRPFGERPLDHPSQALSIGVDGGQSVDVYLRLATHDGLHEALRPVLDLPSSFASRTTRNALLQGLYTGTLLTLAAYNLFMFITLRERAFLVYVAYLLSFTFWGITYRGLGLQYLWLQAPAFNNQVLAISSSLSLAFALLFAIYYMRLDERAPRWLVRYCQALVGLQLLLVPAALLDHYALQWALLLPLGLFGMGMTTVVAAWQSWRGSREATIHLLAFSPLVLGTTLNILVTVGVLPAESIGQNLWQWAVLGEVVMMAFGLADSVHRMKAAKLTAEQHAHQAQKALAGELEVQVRERTLALECANQKLYALSVVDELTGAFNRRHFNDLCRAALAYPAREQPLALCIIDIDHFKRYNDRYGHKAGDSALVAVVGALQAELRRSGDVLCRMGGEEFGVLLSAATPEHTEQYLERLRLAVLQLDLAHADTERGVVSASFGAAWWSLQALQGLTPDAMYMAADGQLYKAKALGRDRVCVVALHSAMPPTELAA